MIATMQNLADPVQYREGYHPGLIASVTAMHIDFYGRNYGFGAVFERKVATEMSEFIGRIDHPRNATFCAVQGGRIIGSVSLMARIWANACFTCVGSW